MCHQNVNLNSWRGAAFKLRSGKTETFAFRVPIALFFTAGTQGPWITTPTCETTVQRQSVTTSCCKPLHKVHMKPDKQALVSQFNQMQLSTFIQVLYRFEILVLEFSSATFCFSVLLLYTISLHFRGKYCSFYSTAILWDFCLQVYLLLLKIKDNNIRRRLAA